MQIGIHGNKQLEDLGKEQAVESYGILIGIQQITLKILFLLEDGKPLLQSNIMEEYPYDPQMLTKISINNSNSLQIIYFN